MKELRTKSSFRNTPPETRRRVRRVSPCGLCGEEFSSFVAKCIGTDYANTPDVVCHCQPGRFGLQWSWLDLFSGFVLKMLS
jgi:hypothetical protein